MCVDWRRTRRWSDQDECQEKVTRRRHEDVRKPHACGALSVEGGKRSAGA